MLTKNALNVLLHVKDASTKMCVIVATQDFTWPRLMIVSQANAWLALISARLVVSSLIYALHAKLVTLWMGRNASRIFTSITHSPLTRLFNKWLH